MYIKSEGSLLNDRIIRRMIGFPVIKDKKNESFYLAPAFVYANTSVHSARFSKRYVAIFFAPSRL